MTIDGTKLRGELMNSGSNGANPDVLTTNEYDGYLVARMTGRTRSSSRGTCLPRKAANVVPSTRTLTGGSADDRARTTPVWGKRRTTRTR